MRKWNLDLRMFEGDGGAAAAANGDGQNAGGSAAGASSQTTADQAVQVLEDGTRMDPRLAERMEKQRKRHNRGNAGAAASAMTGGEQPQQRQAEPQQERTPEEEFDALIHGKYAQQYQQRFQNAISERFKNQADLQGQLDGLKPMLDALAKQHGIEAGDYAALSKTILDDDSLYEDEAEAAGMTVEAYKSYQRLKQHADEMDAREQQQAQEIEIQNHLRNLAQQGEALKQTFPDFDLRKELNNDAFRRLTSPNIGMSVEDAYFAVHRKELMPQVMAAGVRTAQTRIAQSLQANGARPMEGAMQGASTAADVHISPKQMTRAQRQALKDRARMGEKIVL